MIVNKWLAMNQWGKEEGVKLSKVMWNIVSMSPESRKVLSVEMLQTGSEHTKVKLAIGKWKSKSSRPGKQHTRG